MTSSREDALGNPQQEINAADRSIIHDVIQTTVSSPVGNIHIGPTYTRSKQEELNDYLAHAMAIYKGRWLQTVTKAPRLPLPYKFLNSFDIEDASIFCGRTNATKDFSEKVFQSRLLALHAKSGAGKTSLLNAGLFPYIIRQDCLPLYIRNYIKDPVSVIKQKLVPATGSWPDGLHDLSLHEFLVCVCACLKRDDIEELIIVLDQFEDFFFYWTQPSERLPFIKALADCYNDQTLPIRIIISLRKEDFSDLTEFEQVLPHDIIFQNHYRPIPMTPQEMKEAIVQPLKELNSAVTYDSTLLDTLIAELRRNEIIELPLLQIVCTRLYQTLEGNKKRITMKMYEALGRTEGVLKRYLNEVLSGLPEQEKILAKSVLKEFIRFDLTKQTLSYNTLITQLEAHKDKLDRILTRLVSARLLCRDDIEGETSYELVHEYLATEIIKWLDEADREFKRAEELLRSELANWRSYNHLISLERLEVLYPYRERFKGLNAEDWECILRSAIDAEMNDEDDTVEADVTNWVKVVSDNDPKLLSKAIVEPLIAELQDPENQWVRANAADGLKMLGKYAGMNTVKPLLVALQDRNYNVRDNAAKALGELGDIRAVEPLLSALQNGSWEAAEALGKLGDMRAVEPLLSALQNGNWSAAEALGMLRDARAYKPLIEGFKSNDTGLRLWAASGLGKFGDIRAVEPLIAALQNKYDSDSTSLGPVNALGELGDVRAVEPLIAVLQSKSERGAHRYAAEALGKLGDVRAVEPLIAALQDKDDDVRKWAEWALENIKNVKQI